MTQRVDAERRVVHQEDPRCAAPQEGSQAALHVPAQCDAETEHRRQSGDHPQDERPVHEPDQRIGEQILGVALLVGYLHVREDPADMSMEEPAHSAGPASPVAEMGAVRIACDV